MQHQKIKVKHKKGKHNPLTVSLGRQGFSFGYQRGGKRSAKADKPKKPRRVIHISRYFRSKERN